MAGSFLMLGNTPFLKLPLELGMKKNRGIGLILSISDLASPQQLASHVGEDKSKVNYRV